MYISLMWMVDFIQGFQSLICREVIDHFSWEVISEGFALKKAGKFRLLVQ